MRPQYSSDGSRYWTGSRWIPADQVLNAPPAPVPVTPPATRVGAAWHRPRVLASALAALLVVGLVAAAVSGGAVVARHDERATPPLAVPPAATILSLPITDGVRSAALSGTLTRAGVTEAVAGIIDFTPARALALTLMRGGAQVAETLDCAGIGYSLTQPGGSWVASPQISTIGAVMGWAGGPPPQGLRVAGRQMISGQRVWHLTSSSGAGWWIAASTGRPLRFTYPSAGGKLELTFDGFGAQPAMTAPPPGQVSTVVLTGAPGKVVTAPGLALDLSVVNRTPRGLPTPPPGYRYLALSLTYQNLSPAPVKLDSVFTLTGAYGATYPEASWLMVAPALPELQEVGPGQQVSGWDVFLVATGARGLMLRVGPPPEQQDVDFLVSIPVS